MRFASHRDIARAVERGVRRAGLPIAYSAGFTPHPKISYAGAAATGVASEAEYLELTFTSPCSPDDVRARLDAALPDGIDVVEVTERGSEPPFARLEASQWLVTLPGVPRAVAETAVAGFLGASRVEVERLTKNGPRQMDARAAVISMELDRSATAAAPGRRASTARTEDCETLRMVVRHVTPAVRPDDILVALDRVAGLVPSAPPVITRLAQGPLGPGDETGRQEQWTRPGATAASWPASPRAARDEFPRGAADPVRVRAPGNLTGECPNARNRAEQRRKPR